ncbi:hypothetical protein HELRODRAFT_192491, partial [Helobdella robusta]|uniref:Nucleoporin Nup133/Nup155-like N-terminal domain-containing protein n=1 Tax=Helobdella robusta TaxID=6412 RepID=T1FU07_HELRO
MFGTRSRSFISNTSITRTPTAADASSRVLAASTNVSNLRRKSAIYAVKKSKSFLTPSRGDKSILNATTSEFPLSMNEISAPNYQLSEYNGFIPITVVNSLHANASITCLLDDGLAYSIDNESRKIVLWDINSKTESFQELILPQVKSLIESQKIDGYRLAAILKNGFSQSVSCLVLASNGYLCFWGDVSYAQSLVTMTISSERGLLDCCVSVVSISNGFIVGWKSGLLTYLLLDQGHLKASTMRGQQGRLNRIGRRVTSIIFGSANSESTPQGGSQSQSLKKLLAGKKDQQREDCKYFSQELYVLLNWALQKWVVSADSDKMCYSINLQNIITNNL